MGFHPFITPANRMPTASSLCSFISNEMCKNEDAPFETQLQNILQRRIVVFVGGFLNELAGSFLDLYFSDSRDLLSAQNIPNFYNGYSSRSDLSANAYQLYKDLWNYHNSFGKTPIILIGHSKGGAEALLSVLTNPELILSGIVDKLILITPAIGGTLVAEHLTGRILGPLIQKILQDGLRSLTPAVSRQIFSDALWYFRSFNLSPKDNARFMRSIFYIRCATKKALGLDLRIATSFCNNSLFKGVPNDGLLSVDAQILPNIGVDLGILEGDHNQYVISGPFSRSNGRVRKAFTRALFKAIYSNSNSSAFNCFSRHRSYTVSNRYQKCFCF